MSTDWPLTAHENDGKGQYEGRDLIGYRGYPPSPKWPGGAKVALNFVINYEEGGEKCLLHGDTESERLLSEIVGVPAYENERHVNMESLYDYGARSGFWRLKSLFDKKKIPVTVFAVGMALERNPQVCHALRTEVEKNQWEIASHGYRWIDYQNVDQDTEREHIQRAVSIHEKLLGKSPVGFYQGKPNCHTRDLLMEHGGFKYDSDSYADDLPYWHKYTDQDGDDKFHLIVPYTLSENDMRFVAPNNLAGGSDFCQYLKENLNYLIEEGKAGSPKMMSVGLHCRLARPGRVAGLAEFIDYVQSLRSDVWICTREQIADFWHVHYYPMGAGRGTGSPIKRGNMLDSSLALSSSSLSPFPHESDGGAESDDDKKRIELLEAKLREHNISLEDEH